MMRNLIFNAILSVALAMPLSPAAATSFKAGGTLLNVKTRSLRDMHFQQVVPQQFDLSCGAAAMSTLLTYFYDQAVPEREVIDTMVEIGDPEKIKKSGFSMLELKRFAEKHGFVSEGFRIESASQLTKLKVPVLTLINTRGYSHFVVLKKVQNGKVIIADPAFGNSVKGISEFEAEWNHVILTVLSRQLSGEVQFAADLSVKAPLEGILAIIDRGYRALPPGAGEF